MHVKNARILAALASRLDTLPAAASAAAVAAAAARVKAKEAEAHRESAEGGTVTGSNDPVAAEASIDDYLDEENLRQQTPDAEVLPREWRVADGAPVYVRDRFRGGGLSDGYVSPSNGARDAGSRYQHRENKARRRGSTRSENRGPMGPASMPEAGASSGDRLQGQMRWREITKQPFGLVVFVDIGNELRGGPRVLLGMPEYGVEEQEAARCEGRKSGGLYIDPSMAEYCLLLSIYFGERHFFIYAWMDWRADLVVSPFVFVPRRLHHRPDETISLHQYTSNCYIRSSVWRVVVLLAMSSAAGDGLTNIMENHTFVPRAHYFRLLQRRRRYEPQYHSVLRLCSEFRDSRSFLCLNIKKSIHGKSPCIKIMRRGQAGTSLSRVYTKYPYFGDTNPLVKPVVLCDAGVNMLNVYVYGSVQKVRSRFRACPRRIVVITSLKNNHMLDEQLDTTGSCVLQTHRRHFSKDLLSLFIQEISGTHAMVTRAHIL